MNFGFLIDEDYKNYELFMRWMIQIKNTEPVLDCLKDCTLHILTSNKGGVAGVKFIGAYPTMISGVPLESGIVDPQPIICNVSMRYQFFEFIRW